MTSFLPLIIAGTTYDLSHLDPVTFETPSAKLGRPVRVWCWFTTHTFTEGAPVGHAGPTLLDEARRPRVFCQERYTLSRQLPAAVRLLANPDCYVWQGAHERNWMHRADIVLAGPENSSTTYQVFFSVKKAPRSAAYDVEMVVESAYAYDPQRLPKTGGRMKIAGVLTGTVEGKKLHTQRKP